MPLAQLTVLVSALLAWSDITIEPSRGDRGSYLFQRSLAGIDRPSERTLETLRRFDLEKEYRRDVKADENRALLHLEKFAQKRPEAELVYALAELSWIDAKRLDHRRKPQAIDRFLDAAAYAHDYLFDPNPVLAEGRGPSDPRFRLACEIYNAGVDRLIRAAQIKGQILPQNGEAIPFKVHGREQSLRILLQNSPWSPADVHKILLASDFEVTGINRDLSQYGLGVPLIAVRETRIDKGERAPPRAILSGRDGLPADRLPGPQFAAGGSQRQRQGRAGVHALAQGPRQGSHRSARAPTLALEVDLTTPLAYMWSRTDLDRYRWSGLLRPERALERANLLLIRPYEPNKIPVVMVHGLISTPLAWIPMLNELLRDPVIQDRYQFLLYMYPDRRADPDRRRQPARVSGPGEAALRSRRARPGLRADGAAGAQHGRPPEPHHGGLERRPALAALFRSLVR